MKLSTFHEILRRASLTSLRDVINSLERPWQPKQNDALRSAWHAARRDPRANEALLAAIEHDIVDMRPSEVRHVAGSLGCPSASPTPADLMRAIAGRLEPARASLPARFDVTVTLGPLVAFASQFLVRALTQESKPKRHAGGRRRHGR